MKKLFVIFLFLSGCAGLPEQSNNTPVSSQNQPIIIIQDSIVCNSDLSLKPTNTAQSTPTQTATTENGKYNYIFYCFALLLAFGIGVYFYNKGGKR